MNKHLEPTKAEKELFRVGGHNATTLATLMYADRVGVDIKEARARLSGAQGCVYCNSAKSDELNEYCDRCNEARAGHV
jgi:hypothetical protein